ncbi:hypothetical protein [Prosthecomicrobium pneumaticum]|uniref:Uncharacterized protein n=1 Tax=Prosthecomicrobium pneumaticum TaxID=81895 RepID=A0A7W9CUD3_9HYPH|nr:hypothetical protein [Prosthecomicrobium pneumaticum]MBB5752078.1 hypothetical protein [Prosthecomicrobium pneumaticum]
MPRSEDIAQAWNEAIERLGIQPVYPPTEDFYVGDLWAVVESSEKDVGLLRKSVWLGRLDLRPHILETAASRPVFTETKFDGNGAVTLAQERFEEPPGPAQDRIGVRLIAFPGITMRRTERAETALGSLFGASRVSETQEEITVPVAETYGAPSGKAAGALVAWCADAANAILCTDAYARRVFAYAVDPRVLATEKDEATLEEHYIVKLNLQLVTRVYMTRALATRRVVEGERGPGVALPVPGAAAAPPDAPAAGGAGTVQTASLRYNAGDRTDLHLEKTFQRPLVFGYRAVTFPLEPSTPVQSREPVKPEGSR